MAPRRGREYDNKAMQDKKTFKVKLGDGVQLQFIPEDNRERLNAKVIGHMPGRALIITAPSVGGKLTILRENQRFVVRMLRGNQIFGFESEVLKYYTLPYPHVHLSQPKEIESITVRGSRRVNTELVTSVKGPGDAQVSATMLNTSATGALIRCHQALGELNDNLQISLELSISGIQKYLRFHAVIRNLTQPGSGTEDDKDYRYGVQFHDLDDDQRLMLNAFVHEQIVQQMED